MGLFIKGAGLDLFGFSSEFSATVKDPLIPALLRIATVAPCPPLTFVFVQIIALDWLVGHGGGGFDVSVGHIDLVQRV